MKSTPLALAITLLLCASTALGAPDDDQVPSARRLTDLTPMIQLGEQLKSNAGAQTNLMLEKAMGFLGVPYKRGGTSVESGFDCSGFVRHMYETSVGRLLPRRAEEQAKATEKIDRNDLNPGDLVFFNTMRKTFSHVGIYIGDGKFIHAPSAGKAVRVDDLRAAYWTNRFTGARRVQEANPPDSPSR